MSTQTPRPSQSARTARDHGFGHARRLVSPYLAGALCLVAALGTAVSASARSSQASPLEHRIAAEADGLGVQPQKIKHVWLIILENKSYDATFTGLNNNTYLWRTLPAQGVLLKNYYGTGHFSLDNYISLVSGQATQPDTQSDCPYYDRFSGSIDTNGSLLTNPNYGQIVSDAGVNAPAGKNGCVYPASVPTLFNQLDAARLSWKGYAQDLNNGYDGNPRGTKGLTSNSAGTQYCGAPYAAPGTTLGTQPDPGAAVGNDQYVPKHFPFPWFDSILSSGDCNAQHIADLFDPGNGLYHDLQQESTTPAFSWISPNNCSDAHDAVCHGNNLSGGFSDPNTPNAPVNYTGGLYAADQFLQHIVPEIEASPAFRDGGLIDITFDEAFPPFTYTGNSFVNSTTIQPNAAASIASDSAGETLFGQTVHSEPQGPNTPLSTDANGSQLFPGDGYNAFVDRPSVPGLILGGGSPVGGSATGGARADAATGNNTSSTIVDRSITLRDVGRSVSDTTDPGGPIPAGCVVANVVNTPVTPLVSAESGGYADTGSFTLTCNGVATTPTGLVTKINLGPETAASDPLYNATDPTNGGGDTGSVLISPYIRPGSVSTRYYNHYSWLRTMEDLFNLAKASPGLDGDGHIGYAAQPGLAPFGRDVFTNPGGQPREGLGYRVNS